MYRLIYPAQALQTPGYDVQIAAPGDDDFRFIQLREADGSLTVAAMDPTVFPDADMIVIQRPVIDTTWQFIRAFQQHGIRVAVDMDDNFDALHPNNPAAVAIRKHHPRLSPKNVHRAISQADALIVSTPELARVYGPSAKRVTIIENRVPASWLNIPKRETDVIGWSGTTRYHIGDVEQLGPTLGRLQDIGRDIHIVGPEPERTRFGLRRAATWTGWVPIEEYGWYMAGVGVGIVPLAATAFNQAKSWLKGLEFAAVGVPVVASPTAEYQRLFADGLVHGLATKPKDWFRLLRDLRPDDGAHLRKRVQVLGYTYEDRTADWWSAWTTAL
jgi:glycosyltransferase involved in cell wall biosynthesis